MSDEYPREWGFHPDEDDAPTIDGRPLTSLRSGLPTEPQEHSDEYPSGWH